jgi:FKBP-type peptidyl-prolyl cis-trans isomerase
MIFSTKNILWISIVALLLGSCLGASKEEGVTRSGKKFINFTNKDGKKPIKGSYASFYYYIYNSKGELQDKSNPAMMKPYLMKGDSSFVEEALMACSVGDSVTFYALVKDIFQGGVPPYFKTGEDSIQLSLKLLNIQTEEELKQAQADKDKKQLEADIQKIEQNLKDSSLVAEKTPSSLYYIIKKAGEGKQPNAGDYVTVHYKGMFLNGSVFDESYRRGSPFSFQIGKGNVIKGWEEGIALLKEGSKAVLYLPSSMAYGERGAGNVIEPNAVLKFEVELVKVQTEQERQLEMVALEKKRALEEDEIIQNYLKKNKLKGLKTENGLYYIITKQGGGIQPKTGDKVSVHYKGSLLDGKVFDESYKRGQPFQFPVGLGQVIRGWDEGIPLLKEGGKATLVIPSRLAYGNQQAGADILPNSVLRFDVELIKVGE